MILRSMIAVLVLASPGVAGAQAPLPSGPSLSPSAPTMPAGPLNQTAPLSLQSQLGAIPLLSPRALQQATRVRQV